MIGAGHFSRAAHELETLLREFRLLRPSVDRAPFEGWTAVVGRPTCNSLIVLLWELEKCYYAVGSTREAGAVWIERGDVCRDAGDCCGADDDDLAAHRPEDAACELRDWLYGQGAISGAVLVNEVFATAPGLHFDRVNTRARGLQWLRARGLVDFQLQDKYYRQAPDVEDLFYRSSPDVQLPKPWGGSGRPPCLEHSKILARIAGNHIPVSGLSTRDHSAEAQCENHLRGLLRESRYDDVETLIRRIFAGFVGGPGLQFYREIGLSLFEKLGDVLVRKNQLDAARQVALDAIAVLSPATYRWNGYKFVWLLAKCWDQSGQHDVAESLLKKAFQLWEWQGYTEHIYRNDHQPSAGGRILAHLADLYSRTGRSDSAIQVLRWITSGSSTPDEQYAGPLLRYLEKLFELVESTRGDVGELACEIVERTSERAVEQARKLIATPHVTAEARFIDAAFVTVRELGLVLKPDFVKKVTLTIPRDSMSNAHDFEQRASEIRGAWQTWERTRP